MKGFHSRFLKIPENYLLKFANKTCSNSVFVYLIILLTLSTGLLLHYWGFITAFGRSGAILVAVAVSLVYVNHYVSETQSELNDRASQLEGVCGDTQDTTNSNTEENWPLSALEGFAQELQKSVKEDQDSYNIVYKKLVKAEFLTGVIGTLVWGFGDLLPKFT